MVAARRAAAVALAAAAAAGAQGQSVAQGFERGVNVVLNDPNALRTCLAVMGDGKTVQLKETCSDRDASMVWHYFTDGHLGAHGLFLNDFSDNAGAVQVFQSGYAPNGPRSALFTFLSGGQIRNENTQLCLAPGFFAAEPPTQFLKYADCSTAPAWKLVAANLPPQTAASGPTVPAAARQSTPVIVQQPQTPSQPVVFAAPQVVAAGAQTPVVEQHSAGGLQVRQSTKETIQAQASGMPQQGDHYLCTCIISKDDDRCIEAVKAACTVGHIPAELCRESFESGDHDRISRHVVDVIQHGAKCPSADMEKLRADVSQAALPVHRLHGQQMVTSEDHYLCVCLAGDGDVSRLDKQCEDAVRVACMVGHIPEADCFASFDENNHAQIVERILKMIDAGANCAQKLHRHQSDQCANPPCYKTNRHSLREKREPHYLCVCLDDHQSALCKEMVVKACKAGSIPKHDCEVAEKADFRHAVTRHVMHLIDHGSECGLGGNEMLTFTNNRCHCKQEWKAPNGDVLKFPDNCRDPGNQRGYSWCETYAEEGCVGEGDSMSWDRCDHPQHPRYHLGQFAQTSIGKLTPVDHYLCVCVDKSASDEGCVAAVEAACLTGHLDSDACAKSFEANDHAVISDQILELISHGARCHNIELGIPDPDAAVAKVPFMSIASDCGHGMRESDGSCRCAPGYAGARCDFCGTGYVSYPECLPKRDCSPACAVGNCDFVTGTCICPASRKGPTCAECASGYSGSDCAPSGLLGGSGAGGWLMLLLAAGAAYACCCTPTGVQMISNFRLGRTESGGAYSRLNQDADYFDGEENVLEVEPSTSAGALSGTEFLPLASSEPARAPPSPSLPHTGLAI